MKMFSFSDKNKKQKSDILNFLVVCFLHIFLFFFLLSLFSLILRAHCWLHCFSFFFCFFSEFFRSFDFFSCFHEKEWKRRKISNWILDSFSIINVKWKDDWGFEEAMRVKDRDTPRLFDLIRSSELIADF